MELTSISIDLELIGPMGVSRLALSKPVIAAINGYCLAGGVEVAAWTDLRVVAKNGTFLSSLFSFQD